MRGRIFKRKNSKHWTMVVDVGIDKKTGKRHQLFRTFNTKHEAQSELAKVLADAQHSPYIKPTQLTVGEFLRQWLNDHVSNTVRPVTANGYHHWIEKHVITELGQIKLNQLDALDIEAFYQKQLEGGHRGNKGALSARSVLHLHRLLHNALSYAVKQGIIGRNVCEAVDPPRVRQKQMKALTAEDVNRLLEASRETLYYPIFHLAIFTGMRRSELLGLRWCDVDLDMATLSVTQVKHCLGGGKIVFEEPKTEKSRRQIALSPVAVIALREHRQRQEGEHLMLGTKMTDDDLVFTNPDGTQLLPASVTHAFIKIIRRLGLKGVRFHDLRHTHATLLLRQGVNIKALQERLGHSTITTTLDIYAHVTPGMQKEAALKFDEALKQARVEGAIDTAR